MWTEFDAGNVSVNLWPWLAVVFFFLLFFRRLSARLFSIVLANRFILLFCLKISLGKCHPQCFQDGKNAVHNIWAVSGRLKEPYFLVLNNLHRL